MQPVRLRIEQIIRDVDFFRYGYDKYSWPGLWNPAGRIQKHCACSVSALYERAMQCTIMGAALSRNETHHIFRNKNGRALGHLIHDTKPFPHKAAALRINSAHQASKGQVLAREGRPSETRSPERGMRPSAHLCT